MVNPNINCECGSVIKKSGFSKHRKTNKHIIFLKSQKSIRDVNIVNLTDDIIYKNKTINNIDNSEIDNKSENYNNLYHNIDYYMQIDKINEHILNTSCDVIINKLSDLSLCDEYKKQKSTKTNINILKNILKNNEIDDNIIHKILNEFILNLIPPGTKGVVRGLKFNLLIKNQIENDFSNNKNLQIKFETNCNEVKTDELPDFYIHNTINKKTIIGYNQVDLIGGGSQINRANKYIIHNNSTENIKFLSVICNKTKIEKMSKKYQIFSIGFSKKILCYPKELSEIISTFLELN
jgi:hypothetical protein